MSSEKCLFELIPYACEKTIFQMIGRQKKNKKMGIHKQSQ